MSRSGTASETSTGTGPSAEQEASDQADLQSSLHDLAGLVTGILGLDELLGRVATFAVRAVPGADGAGVALLEMTPDRHRVQALASSAPFVAQIDEIQYGTLDEGPCITAARERRAVRSGSLGGEKMWPRFGPRVGRLGVHSALSIPLLLPDRLVGAINVYAREKHVFGQHASDLGEEFASPAAVSVHNAQVLAAAQRLAAQLQRALTSRAIIDQAIGLIRGRSGGTAQEAFARLRRISQAEHLKLSDVAERIVTDAVRRAGPRR
ncbi:GAF and ANTAR domain-containing protein [Kineosporia mesophila]|uniref:GAF and ANTAR domain-containing protein n=1 Tax=Kineosporia mesophila TaxID=566012 RepID=A0ABP7ALG6_9ACTN|nr:GAF and ANTAR domain-containing protein [Kineosporia mesophila]MCD5353986.1 GAF and ANTAR domain-containing protein [Kineosporia mesophila]